MTNRLPLFFFISAALIKLVAIFNTDFDLFGDEAQYWIWSQNLDFGYYSKPPLLSWTIFVFSFMFGNSFESLKLIPFILYFFTTCLIYKLTFQLYNDKTSSSVAAISFYLLPSVSVSSFLLSTDILLIFFWSLCLLTLLKLRKNPSLVNYLLLGIFLGLAFLTKYAAIYFIISLIIVLFFDKKLRNVFLKNYFKCALFLISSIIIILPNIIWNLNNGWVTLSHTSDNAGLERIGFNLFRGAEFLIAQILMIGPVLFLGFIFFIKNLTFNFESKFLIAFSVPIFFIVFIESVIVRANANWAAVAIIPSFIFLFNIVYTNSSKTIFINNLINLLFCFVLFLLISINSNLDVFNRINGVSSFAESLDQKYLKDNKYLVVEDRLLYSSLRYFFREKGKIILMPHSSNNKIKSHFHLSDPLKSNFNKDFIYVGGISELSYLNKEYKIKKLNSLKVAFKKRKIEIYEINF